MDNYCIELKTKELRAHLLITSKDAVRYYIAGINIKTSNNTYRLASTDGHRLLVTYPASIDNYSPLDITIANNDIKRIVTSNKNEFVTFKVENNKYYLDQLEIIPIDGDYPDIKRVIPDYDELETNDQPVIQSHFNFSYLNDAAKVSKLLDNNAMPVLYPNKTQNSAAIIGFNKGFMVLLPMRNNTSDEDRARLKLNLLDISNTSNKQAA